MYFFDGEYKEGDDNLESTEKKKVKGSKQIKTVQESGKGSKTIKATIYQSMVKKLLINLI